MKYNVIYFTLAAFLLAGCPGGNNAGTDGTTPAQNAKAPMIADPAECKNIYEGNNLYRQFICRGSETPRMINPATDKISANPEHDKCNEVPVYYKNKKYGPKYGHYFVLVDSTEGYAEEQYKLLLNQLIDKDNIKLMGPYDKISIINIAGDGPQAEELEPIFAKCIPRSGQEGTMYGLLHSKTSGDTTKNKMVAAANTFNTKLEEAGDSFSQLSNVKGEYSQIIEQIKVLSTKTPLDFASDYEYRKIIIFSDLMQNSRSMSLLRSCRDKGSCISYDDLKAGYDTKLWESLKPEFGINPPEVFVYYLRCKHDRDMDIGLIELWQSYFDEIGIKMSYDIETSCQDIEPSGKKS